MLVVLTRPDGSAVAVNAAEVVHVAPVPKGGGSAGPLVEGTRLTFRHGGHQDVAESFEVVLLQMDMRR